jgi:hypothetical protein
MLEKAPIVAVSAALGLAAAVGVGACGEDREGEVRIEGGTTGTSATGTSTTRTSTTRTTETSTTGTTQTAP